MGQAPAPAVIPDKDDQYLPIIPDLGIKPRLALARAVVRQALVAEWCKSSPCHQPAYTYTYTQLDAMGGADEVPWTALEAAHAEGSERFIKKARMPPKVPIKDPSRLSLDECEEWLKHLMKRQARKETPNDNYDNDFQFHRVWGTTKEPPSWSAAVEKSLYTRKGRQVWETIFDGYVKVVQATNPIPYSEASWKYAYYLKKQTGLEHWTGLPSRVINTLQPIIGPEEKAQELRWFKHGPTDVKELVGRLIDAVNMLEEHAPATVSHPQSFCPTSCYTIIPRIPSLVYHPLYTIPRILS